MIGPTRPRASHGGRSVPQSDPVWQLVLAWEEAQVTGQPVSPEDLCRDCPERLTDLTDRVSALLAVRRLAAVGQPAACADDLRTVTYADSRSRSAGAPRLPAEIPGYEIVGELGRGGMGVVYQARQLGLDRIVAVKMILNGTQAGPNDLARFRAEAAAIARLQHPNIVQIFDVGEAAGRPYFVLEFVAGGSLAENGRGTPHPVRPSAQLIETLARAVHAAHVS